MARGELVRFMAENEMGKAQDIKGFDRLDYSYQADLSTDDQYIFIRK